MNQSITDQEKDVSFFLTRYISLLCIWLTYLFLVNKFIDDLVNLLKVTISQKIKSTHNQKTVYIFIYTCGKKGLTVHRAIEVKLP